MSQPTNQLIFLDTETTGNDVLKDRLCQVCYKTADGIHDGFFKPPVPISVKAMSITHITNKMVADKEVLAGSKMQKDLQALLADGILVAHNAKFDTAILIAEGMSVPRTICTLRVARFLDPNNLIPEYNLQYLRYHLELEVEDAFAHDAMGDVKVLYALFERLLAKMTQNGMPEEEAITKMIDVSSRPSILQLFNYGKYRDRKVEDIAKSDRGYLEWMLEAKQKDGAQDEDWIYTLKHFLGIPL